MTLAAINLWDPTHVTGVAILVTALLLGLVHGITPDEHTWPITFSYAIGGYSTRRGLRAGLIFSAAFTVQRAAASELAYLGLSHVFTLGWLDYVVYVVVGAVMLLAGRSILRGGGLPHLHLPGTHRYHDESPAERETSWVNDPRPWMPAVHGFVAGWGFGAFAIIIYTVLAPAMHSAAWGWVPGAFFGLGTTIVQAVMGGLFGLIAARRGLSPEAVRRIALTTAARTLGWGGLAFMVGGGFGLAFPTLAGASLATGVHVHNLDQIGLPLVLVIFAVLVVGVSTLVRETRIWTRKAALGEGGLFAEPERS